MSNLASVCDKCHTPKNHKPGGRLWDLKPARGTAPATFMNIVRWQIYEEIKALGAETRITYGAVTKRTRYDLNIVKTHANDAYCMGTLRPRHRARTEHYEKRRRNNRILEKFYDAKYVDVRDGKVKKAAELGCNRTDRSVPRNNSQNERVYRGQKMSSGRRNIRRRRYALQPGTKVWFEGKRFTVKGVISNGTNVTLRETSQTPSVKKVKVIAYPSGWQRSIS